MSVPKAISLLLSTPLYSVHGLSTLAANTHELISSLGIAGTWIPAEVEEETSWEAPGGEDGNSRAVNVGVLMPWKQLWMKAIEEEGLDPAKVSQFGASVPKVPRSLFQKMMSLGREKVHTYNFQGGLHTEVHPTPHWRRQWVLDFAAKEFKKADFLNCYDAAIGRGYKKLGEFDYSPQQKKTNELLNSSDGFFEVMAASEFTLCPGGDEPWSMRSYEAVFAGSIPLINSTREDWSPARYPNPIYHAIQAVIDEYKYATVDNVHEVGYPKDWVAANTRTFIKYQTFMEGDNVPPSYKPRGSSRPYHTGLKSMWA